MVNPLSDMTNKHILKENTGLKRNLGVSSLSCGLGELRGSSGPNLLTREFTRKPIQALIQAVTFIGEIEYNRKSKIATISQVYISISYLWERWRVGGTKANGVHVTSKPGTSERLLILIHKGFKLTSEGSIAWLWSCLLAKTRRTASFNWSSPRTWWIVFCASSIRLLYWLIIVHSTHFQEIVHATSTNLSVESTTKITACEPP